MVSDEFYEDLKLKYKKLKKDFKGLEQDYFDLEDEFEAFKKQNNLTGNIIGAISNIASRPGPTHRILNQILHVHKKE